MSRQFRSTFSGLFILPVLKLPPLARLERYLKARRERRRAGETQAPEVVENVMVEKMPLSARPSALRSSIRGSRCPSLRLKDGAAGGGPAVGFLEVDVEQRVGFGRASCRTVPCIVNTEPTVQLDGTPSDPSVSQASVSQVSPSPNSSPLSTSSRHLRHSGGGGGGGGSNSLRIENNTASCCTSGFVSELVSIPIPEEPADLSSPTADGAIGLITSNSQCFWPAVNFAPSNHQQLKSTTSLTVPAHR